MSTPIRFALLSCQTKTFTGPTWLVSPSRELAPREGMHCQEQYSERFVEVRRERVNFLKTVIARRTGGAAAV